MKTHLNRLGIIYTVYGWLNVLLTILCGVLAVRDIRLLEYDTPISEWHPLSFLIVGLVITSGLISLFYLQFGKALKEERRWATRVVGFIIAILLIFQFPVGTIIGGYTLWVLTKIDQSTLKTEPVA